MFKTTKRALALTLAMTAMAGCATTTPLAQAPADKSAPKAAVKAPLPAGWFTAPLTAPENRPANPDYKLQGLPSHPHLCGPEFTGSLPHGEDADTAFNSIECTYIIVYEKNGDLKFRIVNDEGTIYGAIGDKFIACGNDPKVVYVKHLNQFMVTYERGGDIYAQRISMSGSLIGSEITVSGANGCQDDPDIAYDCAGEKVLIVWEDERSGEDDIYSRLYCFQNNQTLALTAEMLIGNSAPKYLKNDYTANQTDPAVAFSSLCKQWVVVWEDDRECDTNGQDIYGVQLSEKGFVCSSNFPVTCLVEDQSDPCIAFNPITGFFLVAFEDDSYGASDSNILGRALNAKGDPVYGEGTINDQYKQQQDPAVEFNACSWTWLVAWEEELTWPDSIMGRHFGPFFECGDTFSITPDGKGFTPALAANEKREEFLAVSHRSGNTVYGQRVDRGY